ncbi:MAG: tetratricopeptide repeat protein, partial [Okeania sp. SIO3B3]|nr:tetratricopeptide repeat protein [Okeania sp. SIO3B3]
QIADYDGALECFDKAIKNDMSQSALNNKGLTLDILGRYDEALECFDQVLQLNTHFFCSLFRNWRPYCINFWTFQWLNFSRCFYPSNIFKFTF